MAAKRIAFYYRTSKKDQTGNGQLSDLERYLTYKQISVQPKMYGDDGVSSGKRRPKLEQLKTDIGAGKISQVIIPSLDRLGRNLIELVNLFAEFGKAEIPIISLKENIDLTTASGVLMFHVLAALAEFERARIRERTQAAIQYRIDRGLPLGRPIGDKRILVTNRITRMRENGMSISAIAKETGIPNTSVYRILHPVESRSHGKRKRNSPISG